MTKLTKEWYTVKEVAEMLELKPATIHRMTQRREIPHHVLARNAKRFRREDLEAYFDSCRVLRADDESKDSE